MNTRALASILLLSLATASSGQEAELDSVKVDLDLPKGRVEVAEIVEGSARSLAALAVIDSRASGAAITIAHPWSGSMSWGTLRRVLAMHGVKAWVIGGTQSPPILQVTKVCDLPASSPRFVPGEARPQPAPQTRIFEIEHGAGSAIYANLRGIRPRHSPKVLYVQGPELIVVTGSADQVHHCAQLVRSLDVSGPRQPLLTFVVGDDAEEIAQALRAALTQERAKRLALDLVFRQGLKTSPAVSAFKGRVYVRGDLHDLALARHLLRVWKPGD